ncbi:TetR/AcrR family transcriptional regulator [Actinocorallia sp. B10E7]|uniref:TetR/AcrR family transcriptional regulator n=1 Tax=Actinocorallia sp. B10E7 TaxID=3153558 RepID=UPI00325F75A4
MTPRSDKRRAILDGALEVFARDGYARASIDVIAKEAGVSTRTIYNHFQDKATLFQTVISESADKVAASHMALVDTYLRKVTDLEDDLTEFGLAWRRGNATDYAAHFALVRQIQADADHIPQPAIDAWQEAGPLRVRRYLADRLATLPGLRLDDPSLASLHFAALLNADLAYNAPEPEEAQIRAAVRVFLYGYHR